MLIRIERDYSVSGDRYPQFSTNFPLALQPYVSVKDWNGFIHTLNKKLYIAFCPWTIGNLLDIFLSIVTVYASEFVFGSVHRKRIANIEAYVAEFASQHNLLAAGLRNMGFLNIVFHTKENVARSTTLYSPRESVENLSVQSMPSALTTTPSNLSTYTQNPGVGVNEWTNSIL
ncbi:palmitoyltransferase complex subunit Erf4 [Schizosaccharomyces osmophilus]|uniref:Ras modification protein ERF4 n=1 Tax=Schizosaccharomyces osmophilus TaxID=2545709 RepID=A0AAF0ATK2_9SCHI|nr:palmitoyltransferase complex subunit Erf4 [Schizosaccharomyces osmophilus]WBW71551.1 palmitoyltransferase complex subunit Erf4 [Schizosaccharomyces osmophilus]